MDVEGSEWEIFEHLSVILENANDCSFLIEVHERSSGDTEKFVAKLEKCGFGISQVTRGRTADLLAIKCNEL